MKRVVAVFAAFAVVALLTVAAQAGSKGEQIFSQKCAMCHVIKGKGGAIGPELTKIASKMKENDLKVKLENPKKTNPNSSMPSFKTLPKAEMDALLGYLKTLK
ncbi:MAG: cytochrome C [Desulfuromonadaceae bacterium GWB2_53_15]|nr:MAG: cytochrome C [Desulfuromonadales bacterium GWD2_54_10]OHB32870.1 MAG: cytochrome C [Desulfuromonadaceae bacterium GWB2_53_15]